MTKIPAVVRVLISAILTTAVLNLTCRVCFLLYSSLFLRALHPPQHGGPANVIIEHFTTELQGLEAHSETDLCLLPLGRLLEAPGVFFQR